MAMTHLTGPQVARADTKYSVSFTELRQEAQVATKGIEDATRALEARRKKFDESQRKLSEKLAELEVADEELAKVRGPLSDLVEFMYQDPTQNDLGQFLLSGDAQGA